MKAKHRITGETLIRECRLCRNESETCNFCKWRPEDISKHKHIYCFKSTTVQEVSWLGKLFGHKEKHITHYCCCGKIGKIVKRNKEKGECDFEITL